MSTQPIYTVTRSRIAYSVTAKFDTMRKAQDWVIYPVKDPENVLIQSSTRIARINLLTGDGMLSESRPNGSYGVHLHPTLGAKPYRFPRELCEAIMESPVSGDTARLGTGTANYSHSERSL